MKKLLSILIFSMNIYAASAKEPHVVRNEPDEYGNYSVRVLYDRTILALTYVTNRRSHTDYSTQIMIGGRDIVSYHTNYHGSEFIKDRLSVHPNTGFWVSTENNEREFIVKISPVEGVFNTEKHTIFALDLKNGIPKIVGESYSDYSIIKKIASEDPFYLDRSYAIRKIEERYKTNKHITTQQVLKDIQQLEEQNQTMDYASPECIDLLRGYALTL